MEAKTADVPMTMASALTPAAMMANGATWWDVANRNVGAVIQAAQGTVQHLLSCQEATLSFGLERLRRNQDFAKACMELETPMNIAGSVADYQRAMIDDYARFGRSMTDMALNGIRPTTSEAAADASPTVGEVAKVA